MNKTVIMQNYFKELLGEYELYLTHIGLFVSESQELASASLAGYDSSFENNFVNGFKLLSKTNQKILSESGRVDGVQSFFGCYKSSSFYCGLLNEYYLLIVFGPGFTNLAFLSNLVKMIKTELNRII